MKNITIIGSGSFGCSLAYVLQENNNIKMWSYLEEEKEVINKYHKCLYLDNLILDEKIKSYLKYEDALANSEYIIITTPSDSIKNVCEELKKYIKNQKIIIGSKGLYNNKILSDVVKEILPNNDISIISGPSHAEQIIKNLPTVINYSGDIQLKNIFETKYFKMKYEEDYIGMQVGAALKNIISLVVGIMEGLNYQTNTLSFIITEGLKEINEISMKMGGKKETIYGLSGLGDLLTTSLSNDSRNKKAGLLLSTGKNKEEIKKEIKMNVESFYIINSAYEIMNNYKLDLNIIKNIYYLINEEITLNNFVNNLLKI